MLRDIESMMECKVKIKEWNPARLPNYIVYGREFYMAEVEGISFVEVKLTKEDKADIRSLKTQVKKSPMLPDVLLY